MPQTLVFWLIYILYAVYFYRYLRYPCNSGIMAMIGVGMLTVLGAQGFAAFLFGVCGQMRLSMCLCSLWGILSFSLAGFTYPVTAMAPIPQKLSVLFLCATIICCMSIRHSTGIASHTHGTACWHWRYSPCYH